MCNAPHGWNRLAYGFALLSGVLLTSTGCAPTTTSLGEGLSATTASADAVRAAAAQAPARPAKETRFSVSAKSGSVAHTPVYFRTDTEQPRDGESDFGISLDDLVVSIPEAARFFLSIALYPVDAVLTPPWTKMESDGQQDPHGASGHRSEHGSG